MTRSSSFDPKKLYFIPLGGSGEIGMNLNVYAFGGKFLLVDAGVTFENEPGLDVVMPDVSWLESQRKHIAGLVITHAHEDHVGAAGYLWPRLKVPIYATPFTAGLLAHKLREAKVKAPVHQIALDGDIQVGPFHVGMIRLTHSIPEPSGLAIQTDAGTVVHTGDWKIDANPLIGERTNEAALKALGKAGVLALVCDSTCVFEKGWSGSEKTVQQALIKEVGRHQKGRVVVACFASNVARLLSSFKAAEAHGRRVVMAGRSLERIEGIAREAGYFDTLPPFLRDNEGKDLPPEKVLIVATGSQGEERAALMRMAFGHHPKLRLDAGDTVLFSSRIIPGNEEGIYALQNQLVKKGVNIVTPKDAPDIHVSGHPSEDELKQMYTWLKPQIAVPVHGETRHLHAHAALARKLKAKSIPPANGDVLLLDGDKGPQKVGEVPVGRLGLDGSRLIPIRGDILNERRRLTDAGVLSLSLVVRRGTLDSVDIQGLGVEEPEHRAALVEELTGVVRRAAGEISDFDDTREVSYQIAREVRNHVNRLIGKRPQVLAHVTCV